MSVDGEYRYEEIIDTMGGGKTKILHKFKKREWISHID
jgi:hypothetical protein